MSRFIKSNSPSCAWLKSLPVALVLPLPFWIINELVASPSSEKLNSMFFFVLGIAVLIHGVYFAVLGLPLFLRYYSIPSSPIWHLRWAAFTGASLGVAGFCLTLLLFGFPERILRDPTTYFAGAGYGLATALAAYLVRPKQSEQGGDGDAEEAV